MNITHLGLVAGAITSGAAIPQVVRTFHTKRAFDLSIWQLLLLNIGMLLWLIYGIMLGNLPLIIANAFSIVCYTLLIGMKIYYKDHDKLVFNAYIGDKEAQKEEA